MITLRDGHWDEQLAAMDPESDASDMVRMMANHAFPLDMLISAELGQLRTFTVPRISRLLHRTRQYEASGKRLDDTRALLTELLYRDPHTPEYTQLAEHLNAIHGFYSIENDDFIYTLSVFYIDLEGWMERYGRRPLRPTERDALVRHNLALGRAMKIQDLPGTWEDMVAWRTDYERAQKGYDGANAAVARGILHWAGRMLPHPMRPLLPMAVAAWLGPDDSELLGLTYPGAAFRASLDAVMAARKSFEQRVDLWRGTGLTYTAFYNDYPTYPAGYDPLELGPEKIVRQLRSRRGCPVHD